MNAVIPCIGVLATGENHEKRGAPCLAMVDLPSQRFQITRSLFDSLGSAKLHLDARSSAILQAENRIYFETALVPVMVNVSS